MYDSTRCCNPLQPLWGRLVSRVCLSFAVFLDLTFFRSFFDFVCVHYLHAWRARTVYTQYLHIPVTLSHVC